jgi:hypothetical protein
LGTKEPKGKKACQKSKKAGKQGGRRPETSKKRKNIAPKGDLSGQEKEKKPKGPLKGLAQRDEPFGPFPFQSPDGDGMGWECEIRGPREKAQMETRGAAKRMGKEKKKKRKKTLNQKSWKVGGIAPQNQ